VVFLGFGAIAIFIKPKSWSGDMRKRLHLKGWSKHELDHAEKVFKKAEESKHPHMRSLESSLFWFTLIIGILGTIALSILLIPVYVAGTGAWAYIITALFGLLLGSVIVMLTRKLHWLEHHHHLFMSLFIPFLAMFNFFIVVTRVNGFNLRMGLHNLQDPLLAGLSYFIGFIIPYAVFMYRRKVR
jgi:hypothetical protein